MIKFLKDRITGKVPWLRKRSSKWPRLRKSFLEQHPQCAACGSRDKLEVHHIIPFNVDPSKELDWSNLITLCESKKYGNICHLGIGHKGDYKKFNPEVLKDAAEFRKSIK